MTHAAFIIDDLPDGTPQTHFNVLTIDETLVTVTVTGSRPAVGRDTSSASANVMGLRFPNAAAGLRFKDAVQLATMEDVRALHRPLTKLPGFTLSTDLLTL